MNIFSWFTTQKRIARKTIEEYKQEALISQGKQQFEKLVSKGIQIPIVLL